MEFNYLILSSTMEFNFLILSSAHRCLAALPPYIRRMTYGKFGVNAFLGRPMKRLGPSQTDLISTGGGKAAEPGGLVRGDNTHLILFPATIR